MPNQAIAQQPETSGSAAAVAGEWSRVQELKCQLSVELPLHGIKVRDVMGLERDQVIDSHWQVSADVPLRVNGQLISWGEFEVVRDKLAVRLTELA